MKVRRKKTKSVLGLSIRILLNVGLLVLTVVLVYFVGTNVYQYAKDVASKSSNETAVSKEIEITIAQGASTKDIAEVLYENGIISSVTMFRLESRLNHFDGTFKQGKYLVNAAMDSEEIMQLLQAGSAVNDDNKITIPEGYTTKQIAAYLEVKGIVKAQEFIDEANNGTFEYDFLKDIPTRNNRLEGYLFPDTYFLSEDATAHDIINKMLSRFDEIYNDGLKAEVKKSSYSLDQIITIASIIEAEIKVPQEREKAASVIYNRLDEKMPLQMCSTVLYALDKRKEVLSYEDLEVESPYNTYGNAGLPIGPIANPGKAAIEAAVYPEDSNYLYFVLKAEDQGEHEFTANYDEFLEAKEKYKQKF